MERNRTYPAVCAALILLTALLCCLIRPAADDFYYATFCSGGLSNFLQMTVEHYRTLTGRVFVHLVLCPLLQWGMWPFRVFNVLLICGAAALGARLCAPERGGGLPAFSALLSLFWLMGIQVLTDGALWGAGALNYCFPTTLIVLYYGLFDRYLHRDSGGRWLFLLALPCAATVEMTGLLAPISVLFACLADLPAARRRPGFACANFAASLAGYLFLFSSAGVGTRLEHNGYADLGLFQRIDVNFSKFDRLVCGAEGIWIVTMCALAAAALLLLRQGMRVPAALMGLSAASVLLTGLGVVYDGVAVAVLSLLAFLALCAFAVWNFLRGERLIPFCMLCTAVSLSVCVVSPVIGPRMALPSGMFLALFCVRALCLCELPRPSRAAVAFALAIPAAALLCLYIWKFSINARVIDENLRRTREFSGGQTLSLSDVPDEIYGCASVPSQANFGRPYLDYYGVPAGVSIQRYDPTAASILWNGEILPRSAVLRDGQYFIPIRTVAAALGAEVRWEYASAVIDTGDAMYCFFKGDHAVNLGHGVCRSVRLSDPVRMIDNVTYISQRDIRALFHIELTVQQTERP